MMELSDKQISEKTKEYLLNIRNKFQQIGSVQDGVRKSRNRLKDPLTLFELRSSAQPVRVGDSLVDSLGKFYRLVKRNDEKDILEHELEIDRLEGQIEEEDRNNEHFLKELEKKTKKKATKLSGDETDEEAKSFIDKLVGFISKLISGVKSLISGLSEFIKKFGRKILSTLTDLVAGRFKFLGRILKGGGKLLGKAAENIAPIAAGALGAGVSGYGLSKLLKKGEAATYNTVYGGKEIPLDKMTIDEVLKHQESMGKYNAVGKYQMMKGTLREAKEKLKLSGNEKFNKETQDYIYNQYLIGGKRPAVRNYLNGKSDDVDAAAMDLAREFASFPVPHDTVNDRGTPIKKGESFYKDRGGNKALISVDRVISGLQEEKDIRTGKKKVDESADTKLASSKNKEEVVPSTPKTPEKVSSADTPTDSRQLTSSTPKTPEKVSSAKSVMESKSTVTPKTPDKNDNTSNVANSETSKPISELKTKDTKIEATSVTLVAGKQNTGQGILNTSIDNKVAKTGTNQSAVFVMNNNTVFASPGDTHMFPSS